jgi:hypothetical protein
MAHKGLNPVKSYHKISPNSSGYFRDKLTPASKAQSDRDITLKSDVFAVVRDFGRNIDQRQLFLPFDDN